MLILTNFAFLKTPPKRLACSNGPSSASYTLADAFHLCSSTRLVGWTDGLPLNTPTQAFIEAVQAGRTEKNGTPLDGRSLNAQWQSHEYTRNIKMWFLHFFMMDITLYIYQTVFGSTYGDPVKGGDMYIECGKVLDYSYRRFLLSNSTSSSTSSLSQSTFALAVMDFLISQTYFAIIVTSLGFAFYTALCVGYHTVVIIGMTLGFGAEEWPRLMDSPWKATGLIDFWGKRWHQTFRVSGRICTSHVIFAAFFCYRLNSLTIWPRLLTQTSYFFTFQSIESSPASPLPSTWYPNTIDPSPPHSSHSHSLPSCTS